MCQILLQTLWFKGTKQTRYLFSVYVQMEEKNSKENRYISNLMSGDDDYYMRNGKALYEK